MTTDGPDDPTRRSDPPVPARPQPPGAPPTAPPDDELSVLRRRVADLEAQKTPREHHRVRAFFSALLIVVAAVLAPLSVAAVWVNNTIGDTDRYVATMKPLASNPDVQTAVTNRVTTAVMENIDVNGAVNSIAPTDLPRLNSILGGAASNAITNGITSVVRTVVQRFVESDAFETLWVTLNRDAHQAMVKTLTGSGDATVQIQDDAVTLDLAPVIAQVKERLVDQGLGIASNIPEVHTSYTIVQSQDIGKVKTYFRLLDLAGFWLPIVAVALAAGGVLLAQRRRRALVAASLGIAAGVAVLGIGLAVFRVLYADRLPANINRDAAEAVFDTLVRYLKAGVRMVVTLGIVVALGAWLSGPGRWARKVRTAWQSGIATVRQAVGLNPGPVGPWVHRYKKWLVWGALACVTLAMVLWTYPTGMVVVGITLTFLFVLTVIEFLDVAEPRARGAGGSDTATWTASEDAAKGAAPHTS